MLRGNSNFQDNLQYFLRLSYRKHRKFCIEELHSDIYMPSHLEGAGTKSSQFSAVTDRFVKNNQAEERFGLTK